MSLIEVVIALVVLGVGLYILSLIPMDATVKKIINILVIVVLCFWLLQQLGIWNGSPHMTLTK